MVIAIIICIPVIAIITGYFTLKAYNLGLKANYELKNNIKPEEPKNLIIEHIEHTKEVAREEEAANIYNEWINGEQGR